MPASPESQVQYKKAKAYFDNGEFFRAYDLSLEAAAAFPDDERFAHRAVLSLAQAGALEQALERYASLGLDQRNDIEARTLLARIKKDQGFEADGEARHQFWLQSLAIYQSTYDETVAAGLPGAYYPGINVAAVALWSGQPALAKKVAQQVIDSLAKEAPNAENDGDYWLLATQLEAELILGNMDAAAPLAEKVHDAGKGQFALVASTGRQLRRLAAAMQVEPAFLKLFTPCTVIHYTGHIIQAPGKQGRFEADEESSVRAHIEQVLADHDVGSGYGSLAAGADILFAEALLARGAKLHLILPFRIEDFLVTSVHNAGPGWPDRFHACLAQAQSVRYATEDAYLNDDSLFGYCGELAMGLAVLAARHLQAPVLQVAVWDGQPTTGDAGTYADLQAWQSARQPRFLIPYRPSTPIYPYVPVAPAPKPKNYRQIRTMLFGDVHGFSKLTDRDLPIFAETIMGAIGQATVSYRDDMSFVNTWGDGIFIVFADPGRGASWALDVQRAMNGIDLAKLELPLSLQLRLGGHRGPAYELPDPIMLRPNYYGAHVSRAARIEPITPEGCVYVTETMAAILALRYAGEFACDYVGYTEMAKHYGQLRIFLLRPAGAAPARSCWGISKEPHCPASADVRICG